MVTTVTLSEAHSLLRDHLKKRPELGLGKLAVDLLLEPPNPFEPDRRRLPRKAFVLVGFSLLTLAGVFVYFNLLS